jgi:exodeoxyribonuclease III
MLIATWNVNSIAVRLEHIITWLKATRPDVLCLQETKTIDTKFPQDAFDKLGYNCEFFGEKTYNGVAIISSSPLTKVQKGFLEESDTASKRFLQADCRGITFLNTYIPNGQAVGSDKYFYKLAWLESLQTHIENLNATEKSVVWCGDFNIAPDGIDTFDAQASSGQIMCSEPEREALQRLKNLGFADAFRLHQMEAGHYSWWDYRMGAFRRNMGYRIDHIWISKELVSKCLKCWIDKEPRSWERPSDHAPVIVELTAQ